LNDHAFGAHTVRTKIFSWVKKGWQNFFLPICGHH